MLTIIICINQKDIYTAPNQLFPRSYLMKPSRISVITIAVISSLTATQSFANSTANSDNTKPNNQQIEDKMLEHITVSGSRLDKASSATGLALTLRQTPQSISVVDSEFIDAFSLETLADVMAFAPGIQAQQAETDRFFFRARGREITNFQFDGVPVVYNSFFSDAITDTILFDRVEIVRGATGLLTGAGEPSAAINLIRKRPMIEDAGYVSAQLGSWNNLRFELDQSLALNETGTIKGRFAASYEQGDSYIDLYEKENFLLYGVVSADLTDSTRVTVGLDHSERNPKASTWGALPLFYSDGTQADNLPVSQTIGTDWTKWAREGTNAFLQLEHAFQNEWDIQVEVERRENEMDGELLYLFNSPDSNTGLGLGYSPLRYLADRKQTAFRAMASGPFELLGREHRLTTGLLYSKQDISSDAFRPTNTIELDSLFDWDGSIERPIFSTTPTTRNGTETQKAIYAAAQLNLHDRWTLIVGNRISSYKLEGDSGNFDHSSVDTPYAGLVFDVHENISIYTSYTEIFQAQNAKDVNGQRLEPVEGSNIEAGIKGDFLNEKLTASFAVYKVEEDNVAARDPINDQPLPDGSFASIGIEGAQTTGYEMELNGKPTDDISLYLSFTYNDAEDADGTAYTPYLPDNMLRASVFYDINEDVRTGLNANWQSEISNPNSGPNDETFKQDGYTLVNVFASYNISEQLKVTANANNLFDKKHYSSIDFYNQGFFGAPRSAELSVRYSW
jgi:outer membrane receptor for ferric coprogen and ferric-rhodotorulic acid